MAERDEQASVMRWAAVQSNVYPELCLLFAVPNGSFLGGKNRALTGWRLKQEGLKPGVPDLCLPVARQGFHGLWIEMKTLKPKGVLSVEQKRWIADLREQGYRAEVSYGAWEAIAVLKEYLGPTHTVNAREWAVINFTEDL